MKQEIKEYKGTGLMMLAVISGDVQVPKKGSHGIN